MKGRRARGQVKVPHAFKPFIKAHFFDLGPFIIEIHIPAPQRLAVAFAELNRAFDIETRTVRLGLQRTGGWATYHPERCISE